jgi:spermidine synthase
MHSKSVCKLNAAGYVTEALNSNVALSYGYARVVEARRSEFQHLQILETPEFGRMLRVDGVTITSEHDEFFYHENLVHVPALAHANPRNVLIVGGGDGGALEEVLKHRCVQRVSLVERDPAVVELSSRHLASIHRGGFRDPRVTLHFSDARAWLAARDEDYDLLILDLTDPQRPSRRLDTAEFYGICRERLAPGGILALHVQSPVMRPNTFVRTIHTLRSVFRNVRPYLVFVPTYGTWCAMATASMDIDPLVDTAPGLVRRIHERELPDLRFYNAATHFASFALPNFVFELLRTESPLVTN